MNKYALAANLIAQVQRVHPEFVERAGARHSATDRVLVQQLHDIAMELGAECHHDEGEMMTVEDMRRYAPHPMLKAAVEALVLRHPGHGNQKVHGNRFGGYEVTKESLRRLKDDKGAREAYKGKAREKTKGSNQSHTDAIVSISNRRGAEYSQVLSDLDRMSPKRNKREYEQAKQKAQKYSEFLGEVHRISSNKSLTPDQQRQRISDLNNEFLNNIVKKH